MEAIDSLSTSEEKSQPSSPVIKSKMQQTKPTGP
jgi:hypothetical protein